MRPPATPVAVLMNVRRPSDPLLSNFVFFTVCLLGTTWVETGATISFRVTTPYLEQGKRLILGAGTRLDICRSQTRMPSLSAAAAPRFKLCLAWLAAQVSKNAAVATIVERT